MMNIVLPETNKNDMAIVVLVLVKPSLKSDSMCHNKNTKTDLYSRPTG